LTGPSLCIPAVFSTTCLLFIFVTVQSSVLLCILYPVSFILPGGKNAIAIRQNIKKKAILNSYLLFYRIYAD